MLEDNLWVSLLGLLVSVILVTGLAYCFTRYVAGNSRFTGLFQGNKPEKLKQVGQIVIGKNQRVSVVQLGERYLVLGVTEQNIRLLDKLTQEEAREWIETQETEKTDFKQSLLRYMEKKAEEKDRDGKSDQH